jgi:hypothetical protein
MTRTTFALVLAATALASAAVVDAVAGESAIANLARSKLAPAPPKPAIPPQHLYLVRATLAALSDANRTGNYSVLRDLAAPAFQAKHSAADLAHIFRDVRARPLDLSAALTTEPRLTEQSRPSPESLRLAGFVPATPDPILFALDFSAVAGHWRLAGLTVATEPRADPAR